MPKNRLPTKIDVARAAGVSHATVTRVMQGSPRVLEPTRRQVLAACRKLNYHPDLVARSLRTRKSHLFGFVVPTLIHSYYARLISAMQDRAGALGYQVLVNQTRGAELSVEHISAMVGQRVAGLFILTRKCSKPLYEYLKSRGVPVVFLDNPGPKGTVFIGTDDYHGAIAATSYLVSLGHRRIAHLAGVPASYAGRRRMLGYLAALKKHGIKSDKSDIMFTNFKLDGGYDAAEQVFQSDRKFTAVFCANDYIAVGLLAWAYNHGIGVPAKMSVVGFTGDEIGQFSAPPLTTVVQPTEVMGAKAVEQMMNIIEGRKVSPRILAPPELLVRSSTARLAGQVNGLIA